VTARALAVAIARLGLDVRDITDVRDVVRDVRDVRDVIRNVVRDVIRNVVRDVVRDVRDIRDVTLYELVYCIRVSSFNLFRILRE
jgi:hypothetical protein